MRNNALYASMLVITACATGLVFTSCADDSDVAAESKSTAPVVYSEADGSFVSPDRQIAVRIDGNKAAITTNVQGISQMLSNADVTYHDAISGVITVKDNSLKQHEIPFFRSKTAMALNFTKDSDFGCQTVMLRKQTTPTQTRALIQSGSVVSDDVMSEDNQDMLISFGQALLKFGLKTAFGDAGDSLGDPIANVVFGTSDSNAARFKELEEKLYYMNDRITDIERKIDHKDIAEAYRNHWRDLNYLRNLNTLTFENLKNNPGKREDILDSFVKSNVDGNTLYAGLATLIQKYSNSYDGTRSWFDVIDEFAFDAYPFEAQGYGDRIATRVVDLQTIIDSCNIMKMYYTDNNLPSGIRMLDMALENYKECSKTHPVKRDTSRVICQIPGAYLVMTKQATNKVVGKGVYDEANEKSGFELDDQRKGTYQATWGDWKYSYVYSDEGIEAKKQEIRSLCLNANQAKAIVNYYQKRYNSKLTLGQILESQGVKGFTDSQNGQILLSDCCKVDWDENIVTGNASSSITCSVWDNARNEYDSKYHIDEIDYITHTNFKLILSWYYSHQFGNHKPDTKLDYVTVIKTWNDHDKAFEKEDYNPGKGFLYQNNPLNILGNNKNI